MAGVFLTIERASFPTEETLITLIEKKQKVPAHSYTTHSRALICNIADVSDLH